MTPKPVAAAAASHVAAPVHTQAPPVPLDARASDPTAMGWMAGTPPPADKLVRFSDSSFYRFPQTRWAFSQVRELVPTVAVPRGAGPVWALPRAERRDLDAVAFTPLGSTPTWPRVVTREPSMRIAAPHILQPPDIVQTFTQYGLAAFEAAGHGA